MRQGLLHAVLLLLALGLGACGQNRGASEAAPLKPEYYRIAEDDRPGVGQHLRYAPAGTEAGGLDIAVTNFVHPDTGVRVSLFGVVHVADRPYYEEVARRLATYEVVLYEGIKPAGTDAAEWQARFEPGGGDVGSLQAKLARWFGFQYQLDAIDYTAANFVHADMTEEEFIAGGGGVMIPSRTAPVPSSDGDQADGATARTPKGPDYGMGQRSLTSAVHSTLRAVEKFGDALLSRPSVFRSMGRRMFAETMGTADIGTALDMMPGLGELILQKRNEVVIRKLEETLSSAPASVAVFYGAAHNADLESRLTGPLGFERKEAVWLRAWALRPRLPR